MKKPYYKELPLFHIYDSNLSGSQKLLMTLLLIDDTYDISRKSWKSSASSASWTSCGALWMLSRTRSSVLIPRSDPRITVE